MYNSGCYDNYFIAYLLWPWHSFSIDILFTSPTLEFNHTNCPKEKKSWLLHTYQLKKRTMSGYPWTLQRRGWDGRHVLSRWWFFRSKGGVGNVLNLRAMPFADEHLQHLWRREISKTTAIGWLEHLVGGRSGLGLEGFWKRVEAKVVGWYGSRKSCKDNASRCCFWRKYWIFGQRNWETDIEMPETACWTWAKTNCGVVKKANRNDLDRFCKIPRRMTP